MNRTQLYQLIVSQLQDDGQFLAAEFLRASALVPPSHDIPPNRLETLLSGVGKGEHPFGVEYRVPQSEVFNPSEALHTVKVSKNPTVEPKHFTPPQVKSTFVGTHQKESLVAAFSADGSTVAVGSSDKCVKIINANLAGTVGAASRDPKSASGTNPIIRTLYGYPNPITSLSIHPYRDIVVIGTANGLLSLYAFSKEKEKGPFFQIPDGPSISSSTWDLSGDYLLYTAGDPYVRLLDGRTGSVHLPTCIFGSTKTPYPHQSNPLTSSSVSPDGRTFVTTDNNGRAVLWDRRDMSPSRCWRVGNPDDKSPIICCGAEFSKCGNYLLTSALPSSSSTERSLIKLWDLRSDEGGVLKSPITYSGVSLPQPYNVPDKGRLYPGVAHFSYDGKMVIVPSGTNEIMFFRSYDGDKPIHTTNIPHSGDLRCLAVSPTQPFMVACSQDAKTRFWTF